MFLHGCHVLLCPCIPRRSLFHMVFILARSTIHYYMNPGSVFVLCVAGWLAGLNGYNPHTCYRYPPFVSFVLISSYSSTCHHHCYACSGCQCISSNLEVVYRNTFTLVILNFFLSSKLIYSDIAKWPETPAERVLPYMQTGSRASVSS